MGPTYPAAQVVAGSIERHFADCRQSALNRGESPTAPAPDAATIEQIISAGFWASLRREEGRSTRVSLAYLPPSGAEHPLRFAHSLPFAPATITRLAPAVERPSIHLGVWREDGELRVWGTIRAIPASCFVLEVIEPGLLVVKRRRGHEGAKFANIAVLEGDQIRIVEPAAPGPPLALPPIGSLLDFGAVSSWAEPANVVVQLAISMRAHGHGGSLLIVPAQSGDWLASIARPIPYAVQPAYSELAQLLATPDPEREASWRERMHRTVEMIAGLTAVDGATILTQEYDLLAFGAKIVRAPACEPIEELAILEPVAEVAHRIADPSQLGGTRHLSAAQFVHDQRDALALVASQDGRFTAFVWPPGGTMVHAHRMESLLL
jgi:hypothetical protein